ncbi:MAG: hypothetical protein WAO17_15285, partial [Candidatus Sulfotelmatobacter sp.]
AALMNLKCSLLIELPKFLRLHLRYRFIGIFAKTIQRNTFPGHQAVFQESLKHDLDTAAWQGQHYIPDRCLARFDHHMFGRLVS